MDREADHPSELLTGDAQAVAYTLRLVQEVRNPRDHVPQAGFNFQPTRKIDELVEMRDYQSRFA
ncbi:hypothetical protein, partial [Escherichia coli]|uniref:hypothetical protein n=1 Tax=Escherichia coli TaxID=562 RepID=UPI00195343C0